MKVIILYILIGASCFSYGQAIENNKPMVDVITEVSQNNLSATITVYTFSLNIGSPMLTEDTDGLEQGSNLPVVENAISTFEQVEGVIRCTFDNATQTFTLITNPTTNLESAVVEINELDE